MLIYKIASEQHPYDTLLNENGVVTEYVAPALFNFMTTMSIASRCKAKTPDAVVAYRPNQALAAISARKVNATKDAPLPYPIILYVTTDTPLPESLYREVTGGLDAIVFENEPTQHAWQNVKNIHLVRRNIVIPRPAPYNIDIIKQAKDKLTLVYVGPIGTADTLGKMLDSIARLDDAHQPKVIVAGTAKARYVMPVVKRARANRLDVTWLGDEADMDTLLPQADGFIESVTGAPSDIEKVLMSNGIPGVSPSQLTDWLDPEKRTRMSADAVAKYRAQYTPELYAERVKNLLNELR